MVNIWIIVLILLILVELISRKIVTIWYAIGALVALLISLYIHNYFIELIIFIVVGTLLTILFRPILNQYLKDKLGQVKVKKKR